MVQKREFKILIIDDSPEDREIFRRHLLQDSEYVYHIFEEDTGEAGLEMCRRLKPDCILLDYGLPDIDGLEFLAELVDTAKTMPYPVVMLTGLGDEAIAIRAMKSGAQDYLVKGKTTPESLHRAIHNAIERVSMLQMLEAQRHHLEVKNQELQAFAYALAHDLRAPLRAISGFAQIVDQDYSQVLDDDGQHYVENIVRACDQMDRLIEDLLNYTRIEHRAVRRQSVALQPLLKQIIEGLAEQVAATQATILLPDDLPIVMGDRTLIGQIFVNLLDNALTYSRPGVAPEVTITCHFEGDVCVIGVKDNGIGIASKHYDKIFHIFQRLHSDEEYVGTGIGLAIVRKSAELMGGQVQVESVIGEGSTFYVRFPR